MPKKTIKKLIALNFGIALVNTVLFSPGLVGLQIAGADALSSALGIALIAMSVGLFGWGNYTLINEKEKPILPSQLSAPKDYMEALMQHEGKKTFRDYVVRLIEQIDRMKKKEDTILDVLLQKFSNAEMSYQKFDGAVKSVDKVFYLNVKSILNKLNAFDEEDYERTKREQTEFADDLIRDKLSIYNEYVTFVKDAVEDNEEILLKLDKLLLEITKFNSLESGEIENMSAMKEIDELTTQAKYYKRSSQE